MAVQKIEFSLLFSKVLRQKVSLDMIDIQVHHSAISLYLDKAWSLSSKGKGMLSFFVESSGKRKVVKISRYLNLKSVNMFEAINSGNHFWYAIKRWRHRDKSRSNLQVGEDCIRQTSDQLSAFVKMYNHDISVQYLRLVTQLATLTNDDSFLRDLLTARGNNGITLCFL